MSNKLLPEIENLEVFNDSRKTYYDSPMKENFELLDDQDKLQILADIVRQTMIYEEYPNPLTDTKTLIGDDYTSSQVFVNYLNSLGIFKESYIALVGNRKNIDLLEYNNLHFVTIVKSKDNKEYVIDTTPDIGYTIGEANLLEEKDIYKFYLRIDKELEKLIFLIRIDMYNISTRTLFNELMIDINNYKKIFKHSYFDGLLLKLSNCINNSPYIIIKQEFNNEFKDKVKELEKIKTNNQLYKKLTIKKWENELEKELKSTNYKEQQKIIQKIIAEETINSSVTIKNKEITLNHITPRLFWEYGLNTIILKPSTFLGNIENQAISIMIPNNKRIIDSYECNLGEKTENGLERMAFFHPHGMRYHVQMYGPNRVYLVEDKADLLNQRKKYIRQNLTQELNGKLVKWYNDKEVMWDSNLHTNLVHSTDDSTEASMHFLAAYPEYQVYTRFNYPNPVLRKEKK